MSETAPLPVLGIVAGGGRLPQQLIECCRAQGREFFVVGLEGFADKDMLQGLPHATVRLGAVGESLAHFRRAGATELVLAGRVKRPSIVSLRPDMVGAKLLARLGQAFFSGDDALLKAVIAFLEDEGFSVVGADSIMASLLAPVGVMGNISPDALAEADIAQGLKVALALGALDVGQAVIVEHGYVLGVEAAEGTDALIERCAKLKRVSGKGGVLVKLKKPGQDARADLPSVGPDTVEKLAAAGFSGIAVEAGGSLILDQQAMLTRADALGLFVAGVTHG
ncbi:MAG: UDP-2,3-diacylglucosamine diphosphatase LpxI [Rickettsiales bacterium]|nr:UDP-2,3-diacylglucosamine diphosphatase LpxI [Rickettsiales bacterium]